MDKFEKLWNEKKVSLAIMISHAPSPNAAGREVVELADMILQEYEYEKKKSQSSEAHASGLSNLKKSKDQVEPIMKENSSIYIVINEDLGR